ncbi:flagellar M-ring protein FliF C-terminal domain-containing protein [Actinoplanes utahensis]|uniref:Flagellar M-ring C-terminal domain-containing protein n=1 Tax=Actinoplanes utahensis TaxID=1869 RepID=A0A0A6ULH1_ACTUT|nr:flagellar M-ring protein FliF C-terminal domain-containing protein [Actinoplanes utahensis]KHD76980.1 hypothetical protein MB27_14475 [Actinoplanes utahensis]GIF27224.1 hypothetical protein Aut01nite_02100 [Actinoplanes utahensis]
MSARLLTAGLAVCAGIAFSPAYAAAAEVTPGRETAAFQERLDGSLQRMLDAMVGPGRSVVTTNVELDLDQVETARTTYTRDPAAGAVSEQVSRRSYADGSGTRSESSSATRANAFDSVREICREAPGDIERLTVAVLVDETAARGVELARVREMVAVAAGADRERGDTVTVAAMPLRAAPATAPPVAAAGTDHRPMLLAAAVPLAALLILGLFLAGRRRRDHPVRSPLRVEAHARPLPVTVAAIAAAPATGAQARQRAISPPVAPEQAAELMRGWLGPGR